MSELSFSVSRDPLPSGLTLNAQTGEISGTPTSEQSQKNFTIQASASTGGTYKGSGTATVNITVKKTLNDATATLYTGQSKGGIIGQAIQDTVLLDAAVIASIGNLVAGDIYSYALEGQSSDKVARSGGVLEITKADITALSITTIPNEAKLVLKHDTETDETIAIYKPEEIHTWQDLQAMRVDLTANYTLEADIEFPDVNNNGEADDYNFFPIKGSAPLDVVANRFQGSFEGKGHTITRLYIERGGEDYVGLFGSVGSSRRVTDIGLISNFVKRTSNVGGLAGKNDGTLSGYATGNVSGKSNVGGLTGNNIGTANGYWDIKSTTQTTSASNEIGISSVNNVVASETPSSNPKTYTYNDTKGTTDTADDRFVFNNASFIQYFKLPSESKKWPKLETSFTIKVDPNNATKDIDINFNFPQPDLP